MRSMQSKYSFPMEKECALHFRNVWNREKKKPRHTSTRVKNSAYRGKMEREHLHQRRALSNIVAALSVFFFCARLHGPPPRFAATAHYSYFYARIHLNPRGNNFAAHNISDVSRETCAARWKNFSFFPLLLQQPTWMRRRINTRWRASTCITNSARYLLCNYFSDANTWEMERPQL